MTKVLVLMLFESLEDCLKYNPFFQDRDVLLGTRHLATERGRCHQRLRSSVRMFFKPLLPKENLRNMPWFQCLKTSPTTTAT